MGGVVTTLEQIQHELEKNAHFNDGNGLLITPTLAKTLINWGITGPYIVSQNLEGNG